MEALVLVKDIDKYGGKYVATKDFTDKNVVSCGDDPVSVFNDAVKSGIEDPVIFYVPKKGVVHIYLMTRKAKGSALDIGVQPTTQGTNRNK